MGRNAFQAPETRGYARRLTWVQCADVGEKWNLKVLVNLSVTDAKKIRHSQCEDSRFPDMTEGSAPARKTERRLMGKTPRLLIRMPGDLSNLIHESQSQPLFRPPYQQKNPDSIQINRRQRRTGLRWRPDMFRSASCANYILQTRNIEKLSPSPKTALHKRNLMWKIRRQQRISMASSTQKILGATHLRQEHPYTSSRQRFDLTSAEPRFLIFPCILWLGWRGSVCSVTE